MARTDHEQELVLGNKQLLSAFFVVVCLLAVFFTAGYIIGSNSNKKSGATTDASANASPATEAAQRVADRTTETPPPKTDPEPVVTPKTQEPAPERPATEAATGQSPAKPPEKAKEPEAVGAVTAQGTPGHQYLQLMAVKRPVADNMVKLLKGRGYPALIGESSKPELFRVLVGPFTDTAALHKTKAGLKAAGFESVIAK